MSNLAEGASDPGGCRHFTSYTGVDLPFRLVGPIAEAQLANRNTFIRAWFDGEGRLTGFDKLVYGEVELAHRYAYHPGGVIARAVITMCDEDDVVLEFGANGAKVHA